MTLQMASQRPPGAAQAAALRPVLQLKAGHSPVLQGSACRCLSLRHFSHSLLPAPSRSARRTLGVVSAQHQHVNAASFAMSSPAAAPARGTAASGFGTELGLPTDFKARFEMGSLLGVGSFGTVHNAVDRASGRQVAVKKLRKDLPHGLHITRGTGRISRQKLLKRLRREIDTLRALDGCASAIAFEGAFEDDGHVFLVMDVCHGGDLETLLKSCGALAERHAAMVVWEVLRLVRACHSLGILHGDIKPSNFLLAPGNPICPVPLPPAAAGRAAHRAARRDVTAQLAEAAAAGLENFDLVPPCAPASEDAADAAAPGAAASCLLPYADCSASDVCVPYASGWLKGVDFGCSHEARPDVPLTKMTGTPAFMAPEVYARSFGVAADMWSLGMLSYQALSDRLPFWQDEDEMGESSMTDVRAASAEPIPLDYGPWLALSPACRDFVSRCLQHDAGARMTAEQAAAHPWFQEQCITAKAAAHGSGFLSDSGALTSAEYSMAAAGDQAASNIVPAMQREDAAARAVIQQCPSSDDLASLAASS